MLYAIGFVITVLWVSNILSTLKDTMINFENRIYELENYMKQKPGMSIIYRFEEKIEKLEKQLKK